MSNEDAGLLLKTLFAYVNDENPIIDKSIALVFEMIKLQLKRDLKKWEQTKEGRSIAGKASAEARRLAKLNQQNSTNSTNVDFVQQSSTNSTVSVSVSDSVSVTTIKDVGVIEFSESLNICMFDEDWKKDVERVYKVDKNKINYALIEFRDHCGTIGENKPKSLNNFKKHFTNWVRKKKEMQVKTVNKDRL
jgi:hypothetical protein